MKILLTQASTHEKVLLGFGLFNAVIAGASMPSISLLMGTIVDGIGASESETVIIQAKYMFFIACGMFFFSWWYVTTLSILSERLSMKTKV